MTCEPPNFMNFLKKCDLVMPLKTCFSAPTLRLSTSQLFICILLHLFPACLHQSPVGDLDDSGAVDVAGQPGGPEGSGTVLTPLQPMSPQRQALLSSRCYQLSDADCWDLPVDYTKIKRLGEEQDHKEVTGRSTSFRHDTPNTWTQG